MKFADLVKRSFAGETPWTPTPLYQSEDLLAWIDQFPDFAMRGQGFGDLSIVQVFEEQRKKHKRRRVFVWSLDEHLASYDTGE